MRIATRLGIPLAAASIALTALIGAPQAAAGPIYCQYKVVSSPNGLFIRSSPASDAHTLDKVPNGTTGPGSQVTTNGYRTFHGGWAGSAYLQKINAPCFE